MAREGAIAALEAHVGLASPQSLGFYPLDEAATRQRVTREELEAMVRTGLIESSVFGGEVYARPAVVRVLRTRARRPARIYDARRELQAEPQQGPKPRKQRARKTKPGTRRPATRNRNRNRG